MKVTVTQYLNVRVGKPSVNAPTFQYLSPGSELDVDGKLYKGDAFEGVNTWVKDQAANYYWSGGTNFEALQTSIGDAPQRDAPPREVIPAETKSQEAKPQDATPASDTRFDYNQLLVLDAKFKQTKGAGITIALVDSGSSDHRALGDAIAGKHNVLNGSDNVSDTSPDSQGTFLAGIIAAREDPANRLVGIAPEAKLLIVKAVDNGQVSMTNVLAALQWIDKLATPPDIINLSLHFDPGAKRAEFDAVIKSLAGKGAILVAAGQDETAIYSNVAFYPAADPNVLGIGAISKENISSHAINSAIDFVLPNWSFHSLQKSDNAYMTRDGCNVSTAIVSGVLALIRSYLEKNALYENEMALLSNAATRLSASNFNEMLRVYKS
ncbi:S8 family peptidase [Chryseolinea soli]|uniref:Peptidase S8/S53 domain-containing protein n=1 Tax=Chryseolinea soli TaxID=2321403 RepID=A0A385SJF1_9BACT|nr:S8 family serine peptidase [Chryseolinea soli]AYB30417.1 hypothetical protein D4L85_07410 [Chryseolinea soli]